MVWSDVDLEDGTVSITSTLIRVKGEGLLRKPTMTRIGERVLGLPLSAVSVLRRRFMTGALDEVALSARLIADQLGHARSSMTQDVHLGRHAVDDQAAQALDHALHDTTPER